MKKALLLQVLFFVFAFVLQAAEIRLGVTWYKKSGMADNVLKGMTAELSKTAPQIKLEVAPELADLAALEAKVKEFEKTKAAVVLMRSDSIEYAKKNMPSIPVFFGAANDPVELGFIKNAKSPEINATGVSYALSYETQIDSFIKVAGKPKKIVLLLQKDHASSPINAENTKKICEAKKIEYVDFLCGNTEEAVAAVSSLDSKDTFIILGSQNIYIDGGQSVQAALSKSPVFSYTEKPVKAGALCGLVADDEKLGRLLAGQIVDILIKGKKFSEVPVIYDDKPKLLINAKTAERLKLNIPYEVIKSAKIIE